MKINQSEWTGSSPFVIQSTSSTRCHKFHHFLSAFLFSPCIIQSWYFQPSFPFIPISQKHKCVQNCNSNSKSKWFVRSPEIRLRRSWLYNPEMLGIMRVHNTAIWPLLLCYLIVCVMQNCWMSSLCIIVPMFVPKVWSWRVGACAKCRTCQAKSKVAFFPLYSWIGK